MDNKSLVSILADKLGKSRSDISKLLEGLTQVVTTCAAEMDTVAIPGFGSFEPIKSDEYIAVNPDNGKRTLYPPQVEMGFHASSILKKKLIASHE